MFLLLDHLQNQKIAAILQAASSVLILMIDFSSHYNNIEDCTILLTVTKIYSPTTSTEFKKQPGS